MNIKAALLKEHSKRNTEAIVTYIGNNKEHFDELMEVFKSSEYRLVQRASWPLSYIISQSPSLLTPYWDILFELLKHQPHPAFKRNLLRTIRELKEIPENQQARIADLCISTIQNMHEPAAIRVFSIYIMGKLCKIYPELSNELLLLLEPLTQHELPSLRTSAHKVLTQIRKYQP